MKEKEKMLNTNFVQRRLAAQKINKSANSAQAQLRVKRALIREVNPKSSDQINADRMETAFNKLKPHLSVHLEDAKIAKNAMVSKMSEVSQDLKSVQNKETKQYRLKVAAAVGAAILIGGAIGCLIAFTGGVGFMGGGLAAGLLTGTWAGEGAVLLLAAGVFFNARNRMKKAEKEVVFSIFAKDVMAETPQLGG